MLCLGGTEVFKEAMLKVVNMRVSSTSELLCVLRAILKDKNSHHMHRLL